MGAMVIWEHARRPGVGAWRGAVVVDQSTSDYEWPDWKYGFLGFDGLRHAMTAVQEDREPFVDELVSLMVDSPSEGTRAWMREEILRPPASVAGAILFDQTVQDFRDALPLVTVPALVVGGGRSKLIPVGASELVARGMDAELVVFEESSHCPFLEEADRFNQVVDDWIQSLPD
jgi:pimeloyl-ACP methyl ester carboxylesterase